MILVCGEALVDLLVTPNDDGTARIDATLGGAPFNLAIGLARLRQPVALLCGLSDDAFGDALAAALEREGVDGAFVQRAAAPSMLAIVGVDRAGNASYSFPIADGADKRLKPPAFPPARRLELQAAAFGSYLAAMGPAAAIMRGVARDLRADCTICLDPNVRRAILADPAAWRSGIEAFVPLADLVKASEEDIGYAYGDEAGGSGAVARGWLSQGPSLVVVTHGGAGAVAYLRGGETVSVMPPRVTVVDTVGAGDAFFAALIAFLAREGVLDRHSLAALGPPLAEAALHYASAAAAIACSRRGADLPHLDDLSS